MNHRRSFVTLTLFLFAGILPCSGEITGIGRGLHAYWPLDTHTRDVMSNYHLRQRDSGNPAALLPIPAAEEHLPGQSVHFDGASQWLATEPGLDVNLLAFEDGFTIAGWFRVHMHQFWDCLIGGGGDNHWQLRLQRGRGLIFTIVAPTGVPEAVVTSVEQHVGGNVTLEEDRWYHIVVRGSAGAVTNLFPPLQKRLDMFLDGRRMGSRRFFTIEADSPTLQDHHSRPSAFAPPKQLKLGVTPYGNRGLLDGQLDDFAIWERALEEEEISRLADAVPLMSLLDDEDQDGMLDVWECQWGLDPALDDRLMDPDQDGLSNGEESALGTVPTEADSDGDGLLDGTETLTGSYQSVQGTGTDPRQADSDRDGLLDGAELGLADPNIADTDGDGFLDGLEIADGTDLNAVDVISPLRRGLYAYWTFDGHVQDSFGGFHGQARGSQPVQYSAPGQAISAPFGQALWLDGDDQYVEMTDDLAAFDFPEQSFTVSAWMASESRGNEVYPVAVGSGGQQPWLLGGLPNQGMNVVFNPGTDQVQPFPKQNPFVHGSAVSGPQVWSYISTRTLSFRKFTHAVGVYDHDARHYHVYVNGKRTILRSTNTVGVAGQTMHGLRIGSSPNDWERADSLWRGGVDDVAVWKRALSEEDVALLYQSGESLGSLLGLPPIAFTPAPTRFRDPRIRRDANGVTIEWLAIPGQEYEVRYAESPQGPWVTAKRTFPSNRALMSFRDTDPARIHEKEGYYRVEER